MHTETIAYAADGAELEGYLAADPAATGPRPAVVVAHAWRGRDDFCDERAEALSQRARLRAEERVESRE